MNPEVTGFFNECVADLEMPEGWEDISYGNDACPSWSVNGWQIFIDHPDPKQRETGPDEIRFTVQLEENYGDGQLPDLQTNEWTSVLAFVAVAKRGDSK
tara:strand:+ start:92 stop:388 length:297 start_codon:yes stop_codon:yes gene_type:complete